jgi:hypothetical protein
LKKEKAMTIDTTTARFATPDEAFAALDAEGLDKANFKVVPDQNEFILVALEKPAKGKGKAVKPASADKPAKAEKPASKPAKGKGKASKAKDKPAPIGGRTKAEREKAKAEKPAKPASAFEESNSWLPLDKRKWIGDWAKRAEDAAKGIFPFGSLGTAKSFEPKYGFYAAPNDKDGKASIFWAETHRPFDKRIRALADLIRAKDLKALKALEIKQISTTPTMLSKLRDLAIAALTAKAEKPAKGKGNGAKPEPTETAQTPTS